MKKITLNTHITKRGLLIISLCLGLLIAISSSVMSNVAGNTGKTSPTNGRCSCHSNGVNTLTIVTITSSTGGFSFSTGQLVQFTVTISDTTSTMTGAGCNFAVKTSQTGQTNAGTLDTIAGSGLIVSNSEITQGMLLPMTSGTSTFSFQWTAPTTPGTYYLRGIGMACNGDSNSTGDHWNRIVPQAITVNAAGVMITQSDTAVSMVSSGIGVPVDRTITFTNRGSISGNITQININPSNSEFSIVQPTNLPYTINPDSTLSVIVRYTPTSMNAATAAMSLTVEGQSNTLNVSLSGQVIIVAHTVSDTSLTFTTDSIGKTFDHQFIITNHGSGNLLVNRLRIQTGITVFTVIQPNPVPSTIAPDTLKPDSSLLVVVRFTPTASAPVNSYMTIGYAGQANRDTVYLHGSVVTNGFLISKNSLSFTSDSIGKPNDQTVTFTNKSTADMTITGFDITGASSVYSVIQPSVLPVIVHPEASLDIIVRYTPATILPDTALLKITVSGITATGDVALYGRVYRVGHIISNNSLSFTTDSIGKSVDQQFIITNKGTGDLFVNRLRIQTGIPEFTFIQPLVIPSTLAPDTLKPDSSLLVVVRFIPTTANPVNSYLTIGYVGQMNRDTVTLHGSVSNFSYTISSNSLNFATDSVGKYNDQIVTFKNTGLGDITIRQMSINRTDSVFTVQQPQSIPVVVMPDSTLDIIIRYTPNSIIPVNSTFSMTVDSQPGTIDVSLNGRVDIFAYSISDTSILIESDGIGLSADKTIRIMNQGTLDVKITNISFTGNDNLVFTLVSPTTFPVILNPYNYFDIIVRYTPIVKFEYAPDLATMNISLENQTKTVDVSVLGRIKVSDVPEINSSNFVSLYPSPVISDLYFEFNLNQPQDFNIKLLDLTGSEINNINISGNEGINRFSWISEGGSKLNSGVYFLLINFKSGIQYRKMIIVQ